MKFKKAFAWILAVAMVITLMPSMAFATSTNTVKAVPTVASNSGMPSTSISVEVKDDNWNDNGTFKDQTIRFNFKNVKWETNPTTGKAATNANIVDFNGGTDNLIKTGQDSSSNPIGLKINCNNNSERNAKFTEVVTTSDNSIELTFTADNTVEKGDIFVFTFDEGVLKSESESGPVEIAIDGIDSYVSPSTLTIATVGSSNTIASVSGSVKTFGRVSDRPVDATIEIRETTVNSITGDQIIKLTLPKGVTWGNSIDIKGNLIPTEKTNVSIAAAKDVNTLPGMGSGTTGDYAIGNDGRALYLYLNVNDISDQRQVVTLKGNITITKEASEGDIAVDLSSYDAIDNSINDESELVIAQYGTESVKISTTAEEKLPTIYSGYTQTNKQKDTYVQLTIEETVRDSLARGRYIDVELPEAVQAVRSVGIKTTLDKNPDIADASKKTGLQPGFIAWDNKTAKKDDSKFTLTVPTNGDTVGKDEWKADKANKWTIFIPVTIRADFTGDIEATLKGGRAGIDDTTIVVGKAESPIKVDTKTTEVKNGVQSQALADITITENVAGYLDIDEDIVLDIDTLALDGTSLTAAKVEVTSGDLEIKNVKRDKNKLRFTIKDESTKPSTISITGVVAALNRTLPEGPYALQIYGDALVQNGTFNGNDFSDPDGVKNGYNGPDDGDVCAATVADYIKIVTPADPSTIANKINAVFTLRQDTFTNNGETVQMDTAPYLDANNRTQLPIRYAAIACGVPESDISWNQATQTATINGQNVVLRITIGSNIMQTSAGNVVMDTAAVSSNGRIFVPIRYIANALGADVAWDATAKTITLTN